MNFLARPITTQEIKIGNITLPEATEFKFLGVWLDPGLTWISHVSRLIFKLNRNMNLLKTSKRFFIWTQLTNCVLCSHLQPYLLWHYIMGQYGTIDHVI